MAHLWRPALLVASAASPPLAATLALGEAALAPVATCAGRRLCSWRFSPSRRPRLALVALRRRSRRHGRDARAAVDPPPGRRLPARACPPPVQPPVGRSSAGPSAPRPAGAADAVLLALGRRARPRLLALVPVTARPPDFLELLFLGLGRCGVGAARLQRWPSPARALRCSPARLSASAALAARQRRGTGLWLHRLGSVSAAAARRPPAPATARLDARRNALSAPAPDARRVGFTGRRSDRKPSALSTLPSSSGEQPRIDIISGVTLKPPSPVEPFGGWPAPSGLAPPGQQRPDLVGQPLQNVEAHGARARTRGNRRRDRTPPASPHRQPPTSGRPAAAPAARRSTARRPAPASASTASADSSAAAGFSSAGM